jgi:Uma2 family endonuclease
MTPVRTPTDAPPLQDGQRLSREEFERRYAASPDIRKAELIEEVVYVPPPVSLFGHGSPHFSLVTWLGHYQALTPGVIGGDNTTIRLDMANEPQPDVCLLIEPARGGSAQIDEDDYIAGAPELVAEVALSSVHRDLGSRLTIYQRNGVREYIVWRVEDGEVDWFVLRDGQFVRLQPDGAGILRSEVFPGLWLDVTALVAGDLARVLAVVEQGLATPEHVAFVARLQASPSSGS